MSSYRTFRLLARLAELAREIAHARLAGARAATARSRDEAERLEALSRAHFARAERLLGDGEPLPVTALATSRAASASARSVGLGVASRAAVHRARAVDGALVEREALAELLLARIDAERFGDLRDRALAERRRRERRIGEARESGEALDAWVATRWEFWR